MTQHSSVEQRERPTNQYRVETTSNAEETQSATTATADTSSEHETSTARPQPEMRRTRRVIYFITNVIAIVLGIRILLVALDANPQNAFVDFIQVLTAPLAAPFATLFTPGAEPGNLAFIGGLLFGIFIYYLAAWLIVKLITFVKGRSMQSEASQ